MEQAKEKWYICKQEEQWQRGAEHDQMVMGLIPWVLYHKHQSIVLPY